LNKPIFKSSNVARGGGEMLNSRIDQRIKPSPNGVTSQCKFRNVNLRMQPCDGWPNRLASTCHCSTIFARKQFQSSFVCAPIVSKTILRPTCVDLCWLAKQSKNLHSLVRKFELDQSGRKVSQVLQVMAKPSQYNDDSHQYLTFSKK